MEAAVAVPLLPRPVAPLLLMAHAAGRLHISALQHNVVRNTDIVALAVPTAMPDARHRSVHVLAAPLLAVELRLLRPAALRLQTDSAAVRLDMCAEQDYAARNMAGAGQGLTTAVNVSILERAWLRKKKAVRL
jgi:hypothetical protein